jgi:hypothetical protein
MMKGKLAALAAATFCVVAVSGTPAGAASSYGPGQYKLGPQNGDASAHAEADPASGKVMIFQHNTRQAAEANCVGHGPRATLVAIHPVTDQVSSVQVDYADATLSDKEIVIDVHVQGDRSGPLGHKADFGPKMRETGSIKVPLRVLPQPGETITVQFGLQTGAGCLPHPLMLGLPGSRFVNGGEATFTGVSVG